MKQAHKLVGAGVTLVALVSAFFLATRSNEPRYNGKTIRQWISVARPTKIFNTNSQGVSFTANYNHKAFERVLDAMGSNAAPWLIATLDGGDSAMTRLRGVVARSKWAFGSIKSEASAGLDESNETLAVASHAIRYLGSNAIHVLPDLERITCDLEKAMASYFAANALAGFGLQALPALRRSLTNAPSTRWQMIHVVIQRIYREALKSSDVREREEAALGLSGYPRPPFEIIFVLLDILKSPDPERQKLSLNALAVHLPTVAPSLIVAREAITKAAESEDPEIRRLANKILTDLRQIDSKQKP